MNLSAKRAGRTVALGKRHEFSDQVRPADLPLLHGPEVERLGTVAHQDAMQRTVERLQRVLGAVRDDLEHRGCRRRDGPQRQRETRLEPAGAVGVLHIGSADVLPRFVDRGLDRIADARFDRADCAERDPNAEHVG